MKVEDTKYPYHRDRYNKEVESYDNLGKNLVLVLELLLNQRDIKFLSIYYRVKKIDSFLEKMERKGYENPFNQTEDICGIRIICYYPNDIKKIQNMIESELLVKDSINKELSLDHDQFGYRSHHIIAEISPDWVHVPNYRDLVGKKAEIQIRTVLMHAWAEIEHSIAYKKKEPASKQFRRKLHVISALLEGADGLFEDLKKEIETAQFFEEEYINIDSLQVLLDSFIPGRERDRQQTTDFWDELDRNFKSLSDVKESLELTKSNFDQIELDLSKPGFLTQVGAARLSIKITHPMDYGPDPEGEEGKLTQWRKKFASRK